MMTYDQELLVLACFVALILWLVNAKQEKKLIQQMDQFLSPIGEDVLLNSHKSLTTLDKTKINNLNKTHPSIESKQPLEDINFLNQLTKNTNPTSNKMANETKPSAIDDHVNDRIKNDHQTLDDEFEALLMNMAKRAETRKKQ